MSIPMKKVLVLLATLATASAWATPIVTKVETLNAGSSVSGEALSARYSVLSNLSGSVQTFGFESALIGVGDGAPLSVDFAGSGSSLITATLSGSGAIARSNGGRFDTTSNGSGQFWQTRAGGASSTSGDSFSITFSKAIAGFGFYATDVGDFDGAISIVLTPSSGGADITIPLSNSSGTTANNNLLFFGFYDEKTFYSKITFRTSGSTSNTDYFGFDDFFVADPGQLAVPEPTSLALSALALALTGASLRKRKAVRTDA